MRRDKVFHCSARLITSAGPVFTVLRIKNEYTHAEVPGRAHLLASLHELRTQARQQPDKPPAAVVSHIATPNLAGILPTENAVQS